MLFGKVLAIASLFASPLLVAADKAPVTTDNTNTTFVATFDGTVSGTVTFSPTANLTGVEVEVDVKGLPFGSGPFSYHIHAKPVPSDGNCTGTGGHLDPYNGTTPFTSGSPAAAQVGDLSGKHGSIAANDTSFKASYVDPYISTSEDDEAYIGNLSVVFHSSNTSRIACANITEVSSAATVPSDTSGASRTAVTSLLTAAGILIAGYFSM
ncbi:superoxide dismutase [Dipodascopsis uninucleata]